MDAEGRNALRRQLTAEQCHGKVCSRSPAGDEVGGGAEPEEGRSRALLGEIYRYWILVLVWGTSSNMGFAPGEAGGCRSISLLI